MTYGLLGDNRNLPARVRPIPARLSNPVSFSVTGAVANLTPDPIYADNIVVGTTTASYTYTVMPAPFWQQWLRYNGDTPASSTTTVICPASVTYDGAAQTCSAYCDRRRRIKDQSPP
ncbi:MAG: hypothetical protein U0401_27200 [Anaerolineae bacterium]